MSENKVSTENISSPEPASEEELKNDPVLTEEILQFKKDAIESLAKGLELINDNYEENIEKRDRYTENIFKFLIWSLVSLLVLLLLDGFSFTNFQLSNNVLLALITGLSANVLGIFAIVVRYLFPKDQRSFSKQITDFYKAIKIFRSEDE